MSTRTTWQPHEAHGDLSTHEKGDLPESVFAFPKQRKEPLSDASHVKNALARFDQVQGVSDADRDLAFANIQKAAQHYGVEITEKKLARVGTLQRLEVGGDAAIHEQGIAAHPGGAVRRQVKRGLRGIHRLPHAPERVIVTDGFASLGRDGLCGHVRVGHGGADGVHADAAGAEFQGHALGQHLHRRFGNVVRHLQALGEVRRDRSDVEDDAAALESNEGRRSASTG